MGHIMHEPLWPTYATIAGSFLGLGGAIILVVTSLVTPVKAMSKRIIIVISIADIMQSFPTLIWAAMHVERDHSQEDLERFMSRTSCKLQSFCITTGAMLMFLWTFGLSQHMYLLVKFGIGVAYKAYLSLYALSVIPFVINIAAYKYDILGIDDKYLFHDADGHYHQTNWCWINVTNESMNSGPWIRRACPASLWDGKGFEIFSYIGVTAYCIMAHCELKRIAAYEQILDESEELILSNSNPGISSLRINKILAIPILFIITRIWGTLARLSCYCFVGSWAGALCDNMGLQMLENFCDPLQGFVNLVLYKLTLVGCTCRLPALLGAGWPGRARRPRDSYEPVTVWINNESSGYM